MIITKRVSYSCFNQLNQVDKRQLEELVNNNGIRDTLITDVPESMIYADVVETTETHVLGVRVRSKSVTRRIYRCAFKTDWRTLDDGQRLPPQVEALEVAYVARLQAVRVLSALAE